MMNKTIKWPDHKELSFCHGVYAHSALGGFFSMFQYGLFNKQCSLHGP